MRKDKYMLILDTFAHSKRNTFYYADYASCKQAKDAVVGLVSAVKVGFGYDTERPVKLLCAVILERVPHSKHYSERSFTYDGTTWADGSGKYFTMNIESFDTLEDLYRDAE